MKKIIHSCLLLCLLLPLHAGAQDFIWANALVGQGQSNLQNLSEGSSICSDLVVTQNAFVYITGICNDSVDFDPGPDTSFFVAGQNDIFLAKYAPSGGLIWKKVLKSESLNSVNAMRMDSSGNLILLGMIQSLVDFDPGPGYVPLEVEPGLSSLMFIAKYDADGNLIWVRGISGAFAVIGADMETDVSDQIYITGSFYDSVDFDPGPNEVMLVSDRGAMFFTRFSENGDLVWVKIVPNGDNLIAASDLDLTANGDIVLAGYFGTAMDFDPGPGTYILDPATSAERYFAKYTGNGDLLWARQLNVNNDGVFTVGRSVQVALDQDDNVFVVGDFKSNVDFDAGPGTFYLTSTTGYATYICKYDPEGNFLWAKMIGEGYCVASDAEVDCEGKLILAGVFLQADFDTGPNVYLLTHPANTGFMNFFAGYDSQGNFEWVRRIGNNGIASGVIPCRLTLHNRDQYVFGAFKQSGDFDPSDSTDYILTMGGVGMNAFFGRYGQDPQEPASLLILCQNEEHVLTPSWSGVNYVWQDGSTDSTYVLTQPGLYWVQQTNMGCVKIDSFEVALAECGSPIVNMPNIFTPNGDGSNDYFLPVLAHNVKGYRLTILGRWGGVLFESLNKDVGWDGLHMGQPCNEGTYYWIVSYMDEDQQMIKKSGFLHLQR